MKSVEHVDEIVRDSFGLWVSGLFSAIGSWNPMFSFEEHKDAFFWMIDRLLRDGKIKFIAPGVDCYASPENPNPRYTIYDKDAHWSDVPEVIVESLRSQWPEGARDENDVDLMTYFYSIPGIVWVGDDGSLVAS
ncbi:hypothetical protein [Burkholderia alba]|uniref:hypothetical protein n=1 Tax=Burkholderia alba TaxID=2683677 RepID=UPI002B05AA83|nr:hypothetical protein [Burkholderia alba]